jgi:hypothetical protein
LQLAVFLLHGMSASSILCAAALAVSLLVSPGLVTSRFLTQAAPSAVDVYNFALNLEYLEVSAVTFDRVDSSCHISSYLLRTLQAFKVASSGLRCIKLRSPDIPPFVPQANFYHCAAYGTPITNNLGGPDPIGCEMGQFSDSIHDFIVNLARNEMDHVTGIQYYLGMCYAALDVSSVNMELSINARTVFQKHFVS